MMRKQFSTGLPLTLNHQKYIWDIHIVKAIGPLTSSLLRKYVATVTALVNRREIKLS